MTRRYFYVVEYVIDGNNYHVENPYRYDNESEAYEFLGKCIHDIVLAHPGVVFTKANVSFEYERVAPFQNENPFICSEDYI